MISTHQYNSTFATSLQSMIDDENIYAVNELLLDVRNWLALSNMPPADKYILIHEIISAMPVGVDDTKAEALPYTQSVVFLLMSIPYEPINAKELEQAKIVADFLSDDKRTGNYSTDQKLDILRGLANKYCVINGLEDGVNIGTFCIYDDAPLNIRNEFSKTMAGYSCVPFKCANGIEISDNLTISNYNIAFNVSVLEKRPFNMSILALFHEMRHHHQKFNPTQSLTEQKIQHISRRVNASTVAGYFTLMEERQAYAFEGWIKDYLDGNEPRSEMQITCDNLWLKADMSGEFIDYLHGFNQFVSQPKRQNLKPVVVQPKILAFA